MKPSSWPLVAVLLSVTPSEATPPTVRILIKKAAHELVVVRGGVEVKRYKVAIGPGGAGFKTHEGDRVTPVGHYHVTMHQRSVFHLFLRLDYPNNEDWTRFSRLVSTGQLPHGSTIGGDIGIHGGSPSGWAAPYDWTLGCIALDDAQIDEVGALATDGTPVDIED